MIGGKQTRFVLSWSEELSPKADSVALLHSIFILVSTPQLPGPVSSASSLWFYNFICFCTSPLVTLKALRESHTTLE